MSANHQIDPPSRFIGLHGHTNASVFDGLGYPNEHIDFVLENGMDAWALTEHGSMNSYAHAYLHAKELRASGREFKFIPGIEFYIHPDIDEWKRLKATSSSNDASDSVTSATVVEDEDESKRSKHFDPLKRRHHLVALARSRRGLENLFTLVSRSYDRGNYYRFPRIDYRMLKEHSEDIIVLSACIAGTFAWDTLYELRYVDFDAIDADALTAEQRVAIVSRMSNTLDRLADAVGASNVFAEIQFNALPAQHAVNRCLIEMARHNDIRLVATADSHYPRPELWQSRELYRLLGRMNHNAVTSAMLPMSIDQLKCELYPKNASQMWESYTRHARGHAFYDDAIVRDAIEMSHTIAHDMIGDVEPDTSIKLPSYVIPDGMSAMTALIALVKQGIKRKNLSDKRAYVERARSELSVIKEKGLAEYFLTVKRIIDIAQKDQLVGVGRGSAAGSLVNYVLGITQVDPIKHDLLFERFVSRSRSEPPDIDSDFADRAALIGSLKHEFGDHNVIPISNHNTFQLRSLVKDIARFYDVPFAEANDATRGLDDVMRKVLGPGDDKNLFQLTYDDAVKHNAGFATFIERHPEIAVHVKVLFKQNKTIGRHAGGVIVSENIQQRMPVIAVRNEQQTPWVEGMHYKHLDKLGWVKVDTLGLLTLEIIQRCISLIIERCCGHMLSVRLDDDVSFTCRENDDVLLSDGVWRTCRLLDASCDVAGPVRMRCPH